MMHVIIEEGLVDEAFIAEPHERLRGAQEERRRLQPRGDGADLRHSRRRRIREVARLYATSRASMILWGMGISQHVHGTDNARCLIALTLMTGPDRPPGHGPASAARPEQRAGRERRRPDPDDVSRLPARRQRAGARALRERCGARTLDPKPGLTVVEIMNAVHAGKIRGMYIMGENPAMSDPDVHHARQALAELEMLVVQDIFLTETGYLADVILPASAFPEKTGTFTNTDRIGAARPPGARAAGRGAPGPRGSSVAMAKRLGLDWNYAHPSEVFDEMRQAMPSIAGITWERLEREKRVTYPCEKEGDPGERVVFTEDFPTRAGTARFVPADDHPGRRAARHRVSVRADHRPPARALAHRQHDAARRSARRDRARAGRIDASASTSTALGVEARRRDHRRVAPRQHHALRRAPTTARRAARCSFRSATTRRRPTC